MAVKTQKSIIKKPKSNARWQITLPKNDEMGERIDSLLKTFKGMSIVEITKLALIKLDDEGLTKYDKMLDDYYDGNLEMARLNPGENVAEFLSKMKE